MKMIIGLGNPGDKYEKTRHNVGFMLVDMLAVDLKVAVSKSKYQALLGEAQLDGEKIILVKPQTYMNLSGEAVGQLVRWYKLAVEDILVVYDDMDLPFGKLRIRSSGGPGGHNGMKSIIAHLGTNKFNRMRIGIGQPGVGDVDHVLGRFSKQELAAIEQIINKTIQAIYTFVQQDLNVAMNKFNC